MVRRIPAPGPIAGVIHVAGLDDPRLRDYQATVHPQALRASGLFVAEGRLVVQRLLEANRYLVRSVLVTPAALESLRGVVDIQAGATPIYVVAQHQMNEIVGFKIHRGCLALAERPVPLVFEDVPLSSMRRILALEGVSNPDNIGGLFRNAAAFDVDMVVLGPGCGDPLYRKAIRTSMAASLLVPFAQAVHWPDAIRHLRKAAFQTLALTPAPDAVPLHHVALTRRIALLLGSEGDGLSPATLAESDARVQISMAGRIDSLNVATAAAVALYHLGTFDHR